MHAVFDAQGLGPGADILTRRAIADEQEMQVELLCNRTQLAHQILQSMPFQELPRAADDPGFGKAELLPDPFTLETPIETLVRHGIGEHQDFLRRRAKAIEQLPAELLRNRDR